ncbi:MAG: putative hydro-lyase [Desulfarculus sp.]|nr:putative hydro-lyase [Desulfarculus sp.]
MTSGQITGNTSALCPGHAQANLVILPLDWAEEFALFCERNPKPCPLLERLQPGDPFTRFLAPAADVRDTLPRYRVWERGLLQDEPTDIRGLWRGDLVSFFLGCSFSFDLALQKAGVPVRHLEQGRNVPMYRTSRPNQPAGRLGGPLVVSMRPMAPDLVPKAVEISGRFTRTHGAPVYWGDPAGIGIGDIARPDFGEAVDLRPGEVPVFWACGVTPQAALMEAKPPLAITHAPGCMFIADRLAEELD